MELADFLRDRFNLILKKAEERIAPAYLTRYEQAGPHYLRARLSTLCDFALRYICENQSELPVRPPWLPLSGPTEKSKVRRKSGAF